MTRLFGIAALGFVALVLVCIWPPILLVFLAIAGFALVVR